MSIRISATAARPRRRLTLGNPLAFHTGPAVLSAANTEITLSGDAWVWTPISTYHATHRTVMEFDFTAENLASFHEIGFDTDTVWGVGAETNRNFDLGGESTWDWQANHDFRLALPDGTIHVQIPIGEYLSDSEKAQGLDITHLVFMNYDPRPGLSPLDLGKSIFSNIKLYESDEVRTVTTYDPRGNVETVRTASDPRNITTSYAYDRLGRQTKKTLDDGGSMERQYVTVYDATGNVLVEQNPSGAIGSGEFVQTVHEYDRFGRIVKTTLPDPDGIPGGATGLASEVNTFAYDASGNLVSQTNGEGETTHSAFDSQGRKISQTDGNGDVTRYRYDSEGNLIAVIDAAPDHNVTKYTYDGLNRQKTETIRALVGTTPTELTRTNTYDLEGNLSSTTDRNGNTRLFQYDALGRRTDEIWAVGSQIVRFLDWRFDDLGRVIREADNNGTTTTTADDFVNTFSYDGLGRLIDQKNYDASSTGRPLVHQTFSYAFDFVSDAFGPGEFQDQVHRREYLGSGGNTAVAETLQQYDRVGNLSSVRDYDINTGSSAPIVDSKEFGFTYDAANNLRSILRTPTYIGDYATTYEYDAANRLTSIWHNVPADIAHIYGYDNASRINQFISSSDVFLSDDRHYLYDDAGQLTSKTGGSAESYAYDDNGNRAFLGSQSIVTSLGNRLKSDGTYNYDYDGEGNLKSRTRISTAAASDYLTEYAWDHRDRLTGVTFKNNSGTVTKWVAYTYDAENRRVKRAFDPDGAGGQPTASEYFVYDGSNLSMRFNNAQQLTHRYLYGPQTDQVLADEVFTTVGSQQVSDEVLWQVADHEGTIRDIVNANGTLRKHVDYVLLERSRVSCITIRTVSTSAIQRPTPRRSTSSSATRVRNGTRTPNSLTTTPVGTTRRWAALSAKTQAASTAATLTSSATSAMIRLTTPIQLDYSRPVTLSTT